MFGLGMPELMVILIVALIIFGPRKLPEIGAAIGRALGEFRKASTEIESQVRREFTEVTSLNKSTPTKGKEKEEEKEKEENKEEKEKSKET
ncbi:MAG: TatA/E family twin arginine-targeting protein translocase [Actinomycetota bacterium]|nr:TatA/E family twin arginine-targeting protein translocase [Actinomycetota bacterium]